MVEKKVIILGTAPTLNNTPWDQDDVTYWACQPVITHKPCAGHRLDALFEFHKQEYWETIKDRLNAFIKDNPNTVLYMQDKYPQIKNSEKYPLAEVQTMLNHPRLRNYFQSTIAYIVALAILKGFNKIELYGVHMSSDEEEYSLQRENMTALLAFAWGRGIDFWLPDESQIMKSDYLYGYEQEKGFILKLINYKKGLINGEKNLEKKLQATRDEYNQQKGGVMAFNNFINEQIKLEHK